MRQYCLNLSFHVPSAYDSPNPAYSAMNLGGQPLRLTHTHTHTETHTPCSCTQVHTLGHTRTVSHAHMCSQAHKHTQARMRTITHRSVRVRCTEHSPAVRATSRHVTRTSWDNACNHGRGNGARESCVGRKGAWGSAGHSLTQRSLLLTPAPVQPASRARAL